jgi:endogenous inhibitor of DNA gyrase (YacG/DUF329 family)
MLCPICKKESRPEGNPFRPFCSERCKLIDLDHWLSGRYRIPVRTGDEEENVNAGNTISNGGEREQDA